MRSCQAPSRFASGDDFTLRWPQAAGRSVTQALGPDSPDGRPSAEIAEPSPHRHREPILLSQMGSPHALRALTDFGTPPLAREAEEGLAGRAVSSLGPEANPRGQPLGLRASASVALQLEPHAFRAIRRHRPFPAACYGCALGAENPTALRAAPCRSRKVARKAHGRGAISSLGP